MSAITDVHHQAGLLLAYTQVLQMQDDADAVDIILRRRWRRTPRRSKFWVRVRQDEGRRLIHYRVSLATAWAAIWGPCQLFQLHPNVNKTPSAPWELREHAVQHVVTTILNRSLAILRVCFSMTDSDNDRG